jgi:phosphohistidine phosphatase
MRVYLVQHGAAKTKEQDAERPLTDLGRDEVGRVSRAAGSLAIHIATIFHSGKTRARQTADIFARHLEPASGVAELAGLGPTDDPEIAYRILTQREESVMLVGHLPHLGRLASLLITGEPADDVIAFRNAGLVCLARTASQWTVQWVLTPELIIATGPS